MKYYFSLFDGLKFPKLFPFDLNLVAWQAIFLQECNAQENMLWPFLKHGRVHCPAAIPSLSGVRASSWMGAYTVYAIWEILDRRLRKNNISSIAQLKSLIGQEWIALKKDRKLFQNLVNSMPKRVEELIKAKGGVIKY